MDQQQQQAAPERPPASPIKRELDRIRAAAADAVLDVEEQPERGMFWVTIRPSALLAVLKLLRDDPALEYRMLSDLFCVDYPDRPERFNLVYHLYSLSRNQRLFLRIHVGEDTPVPTVSELFPSANWAEREIFDLFGVPFSHHPDLRRILMPDEWEGHPLRKDYPLVGRRPVILYNDVRDLL